MLWAYLELLQSYRRPKRALDWIAFMVSGILGGLATGGIAVGLAFWLMRLSGTTMPAKLIGGMIGLLTGWLVILTLNVQLFRLCDWIYESFESEN
jgi:integral membrane sensor domain MASE1